MGIRLLPNSVSLNDLERCNSPNSSLSLSLSSSSSYMAAVSVAARSCVAWVWLDWPHLAPEDLQLTTGVHTCDKTAKSSNLEQ